MAALLTYFRFLCCKLLFSCAFTSTSSHDASEIYEVLSGHSIPIMACVRVNVCMCERVSACMRACMRLCICVCARARVTLYCTFVCVCECVWVCTCLCARASAYVSASLKERGGRANLEGFVTFKPDVAAATVSDITIICYNWCCSCYFCYYYCGSRSSAARVPFTSVYL